MEQEQLEVLEKNRPKLANRIKLNEDLWNEMRAKKIVTQEVQAEIKLKGTEKAQIGHLLDHLCKHPSNVELFCTCLKETGQEHIVNLLTSEHNGRKHQAEMAESIDEYCDKLNAFHQEAIEAMKHKMPMGYDVSKYAPLRLCPDGKSFGPETGTVLNEYIKAAQQNQGYNIELENLFSAGKPLKYTNQITGHSDKGTRGVVIVGVPGCGKTLLCYHILESITQKNLFQDSVKLSFLIKFRDVNEYRDTMSFQSLLLSYHGPTISTTDMQSIWTRVVRDQSKVLIILDGYDEMEEKEAITFTSMEENHRPSVLLHNLINGNLMGGARVIITTRPHCVQQLKSYNHRLCVVNIASLGWEEMRKMVEKYGEGSNVDTQSVLEYIEANRELRALCSVPINVRGLLDYIQWAHQGQITVMKDKMPSTMAGLFLVLLIKMLQVSDRTVQKYDHTFSPEDTLQKRSTLLQKLAYLAYQGIVVGSKQRFSGRDLVKGDLKEKDVEESIMTCSSIRIKGEIGVEIKKFFSFPHLTFQEHLAALHLTQLPVEEVERLALKNKGQHDSLLSMYVGATRDEMTTGYLPHIYPGKEPQRYLKKCRRIVKAIWMSNRRWENTGRLFGLSMYHSSAQWDMASKLIPHMYDHHQVWNPPLDMTPTEWTAVNCYLHHVPGPLCCMRTVAINTLVDNLESTIFTGVDVNMRDASEMRSLQTLLTQNQNLTSLGLKSSNGDVWSEWSQGNYKKLRCVRLNTEQQHVTLDTLLTPLNTIQHLDTLAIEGMFDKDRMSVKAPRSLQDLKHLCIQANTGLGMQGNIDVESLCGVILHGNLTWLHLNQIQLGDGQVDILAGCLSHDDCRLRTLRLEDCDMTACACQKVCQSLRQNDQLTALEMSRHSVSEASVSHLSCLLEHNSTLRELDIKENGITEIGNLYVVLRTRHNLHVLDLSGNVLSATSKSRLCAALCVNTSLQVLIMERCGHDDASVDGLIESLRKNTHLKALSLQNNRSITVQSVERLITETSLELLDVRQCRMDYSKNMGNVAKALCRNLSMQVLGLFDQESDLGWTISLLAELCDLYPGNGPLRALYLPCRHVSTRTAGASLADRLNVPDLIRHQALDFDLAADTGRRWISLPVDRRWWLLKRV